MPTHAPPWLDLIPDRPPGIAQALLLFTLVILAGPAWARAGPGTGSGPPALAPPASTAPPQLGPYTISTRDGQESLAVGLAMQLQLAIESKDTGDDQDLDNEIKFRRIRPTLSGRALGGRLSAYLHLSTAPGSLELMDMYVSYSLPPGLQVRLGQWKIPFTRYRIASFKDLTFVDWSLVTRYFGAERQVGIALHNGCERPPAWQVEAGVFTGINARASHAVGLAALYGESTPNPSDLTNPASPAAFHPELVLHLAHNTGGIDVKSDTDRAGGPLRLSAGLSLTWDLDPDPRRDLSLRLAPELLLKWRGLSVFGVFYLGLALQGEGLQEPNPITDQTLALLGGLAQTSYLFRRRIELSARYAVVAPDPDLLEGARRRADRLIAAAPDSSTSTKLSAQYKNAGQIELEQEITFGINVYFLGSSLKWQNDLGWRLQSRTGGRTDSILFRSQVQLSF